MIQIKAQKYAQNPILVPRVQEKSFERACVYNPAAIVKDELVATFPRTYATMRL